MVISIQLDPATAQRLERLALRSGQSTADYLRELVTQGLEDREDGFLAAEILERVRLGEEAVYSAAQVRAELEGSRT